MRLPLFEIHDQAWCPRLFRDGLTDFLQTSIESLDTYEPIRARLFDAIAASGAARVLDLCSGAGGPWCAWRDRFSLPATVLLTDRRPNAVAVQRINGREHKDVTYCPDPVDAAHPAIDEPCFRTLFTACHHFSPTAVSAIIENAVRAGNGIGISEMTSRKLSNIAAMLFLTPIGVWILTPRIPNLTWRTKFFTYFVPLIPAIITIDGVLSCLRSYSPKELMSLAGHPEYEWESGREGGVTFLVGRPLTPALYHRQ